MELHDQAIYQEEGNQEKANAENGHNSSANAANNNNNHHSGRKMVSTETEIMSTGVQNNSILR